MLCLVAEKIHAGQNPDAAKKKGDDEKCLFRYPPFPTAGFSLINAHDTKTDEVYCDDIYDQ